MPSSQIDRLIGHFDGALRTLSGATRTERPNPASYAKTGKLTDEEIRESGRLMRVNHTGEVCAQALYLGQGLTSRNPSVKAAMKQAAAEESDHLGWCEQRLKQLNTHTSLLNPGFFALSFAAGAVTGLISDRVNLGFVAATEEQVVKHLDSHLQKLPSSDHQSRALLTQMKEDEARHRTTALDEGGLEFPQPVKNLMSLVSKFMTKSTYWV